MKALLVAALLAACGKSKSTQTQERASEPPTASAADAAAAAVDKPARKLQPLRIDGTYDADGRKTGTWTWAEGYVTASAQFVNGLAEGRYEREDNLGKAVGTFASSERSGEWTYYWAPGGTLQARGRYERDRRVGEWTFFHAPDAANTEQIAARGTYKAGERDGTWSFYAADGARSDEATAIAAYRWLEDWLPDPKLNIDTTIVELIGKAKK